MKEMHFVYTFSQAELQYCCYVHIFITDINECLDNSGTCSHICHNTQGSYHCECPTGYLLKADNHTCQGEQFN